MKDSDVCKNVLLKKIRCFPFGFHFSLTLKKKIFPHPGAKNTLGHVGKGGRPGEHHQNPMKFCAVVIHLFLEAVPET